VPVRADDGVPADDAACSDPAEPDEDAWPAPGVLAVEPALPCRLLLPVLPDCPLVAVLPD